MNNEQILAYMRSLINTDNIQATIGDSDVRLKLMKTAIKHLISVLELEESKNKIVMSDE